MLVSTDDNLWSMVMCCTDSMIVTGWFGCFSLWRWRHGHTRGACGQWNVHSLWVFTSPFAIFNIHIFFTHKTVVTGSIICLRLVWSGETSTPSKYLSEVMLTFFAFFRLWPVDTQYSSHHFAILSCLVKCKNILCFFSGSRHAARGHAMDRYRSR